MIVSGSFVSRRDASNILLDLEMCFDTARNRELSCNVACL